jgi:hypothetical protein
LEQHREPTTTTTASERCAAHAATTGEPGRIATNDACDGSYRTYRLVTDTRFVRAARFDSGSCAAGPGDDLASPGDVRAGNAGASSVRRT